MKTRNKRIVVMYYHTITLVPFSLSNKESSLTFITKANNIKNFEKE